MNKRIALMLAGIVIVNVLACTAQPVALPPTPTATATVLPTPTATASPTPVVTDEQLAQQALIEFFDRLHRGDYAAAVELFGGSYESIIAYVPNVDPADYPALLQGMCNIHQCLKVKQIVSSLQWRDDYFLIGVQLEDPEGGVFTFGPCCGASLEEFPPRSVFEYLVMKRADQTFVVIGLPPYVP
ncbi:hypothetical protein [Chloroflexus islandicus]|nr:hypothetical protein [Chloroflexus islandicus]